MKFRTHGIGLALAFASGLLLAGCENLHPAGMRAKRVVAPLETESGADRDDPKVASPQEAKGFFNASRRPGAWSSEASDIEKNLGVGAR